MRTFPWFPRSPKITVRKQTESETLTFLEEIGPFPGIHKLASLQPGILPFGGHESAMTLKGPQFISLQELGM